MSDINEKKGFLLFLDDTREVEDASVNTPLVRLPSGIFHTGFNPLLKVTNTESSDWMIARNFAEFKTLVDYHGIPDMVSFDHDLDPTASRECIKALEDDREFRYENVKEKTGLDCVKYLLFCCGEQGKKVPTYFIHSANPMGSDNMRFELESYKKAQND